MSNTHNKFPVGISDFRKLLACRNHKTNMRRSVDKSLFIRDILESETEVSLFTRPRRFGKTLSLSMLEHFFSASVNGEPTAGMFDDLKIGAYPEYMEHQGQYPVIFMSFKDVKGENFSLVLYEMLEQIRGLYSKYEYLLESPNISAQMKKYFNQVLNDEVEDSAASGVLKKLSECLYLHHKTKVIILIDEYDSPIHSAYINGYYSDCINFMRSLLSKALKDNSALQFGVVTGILRVAKESIFSGLNNLGVYSVLDPEFSEYFGFTEEEVNYLIDQSENKSIDPQEIQKNYNGYSFGERVIYNPWSIVNCLNRNGKITNYWINTADNSLIKRLVVDADEDTKRILGRLIQGETVQEIINESLVFEDISDNSNSVIMFLLMSGYLTAKNVVYDLPNPTMADIMIPNLEILKLYYEIVQGWLGNLSKKKSYNKILHQLLSGDVASFTAKLQETTQSIVSYFDVGCNSQEKFYHGLMLGITVGVTQTHEVRSNRESGRGRYDLMIIPKDVKQYPLGIVMEFKFVKDESQIASAAEAALAQIQEQNYAQELAARGINQILMIGIGFAGKEVAVKHSLQPESYS